MVIIILIITTHLLSTYYTSGMVPGILTEFSHGLLPSTPLKVLACWWTFTFFKSLPYAQTLFKVYSMCIIPFRLYCKFI